jgi:Sulfotransferase family
VPETEIVLTDPLSVRAASRARVTFSIDSPEAAELIVEHLRVDQLLAREGRPLTPGAKSQEIKTHPDSSHIACSISVDGLPVVGVRFRVECGERIEPTTRHFIVIGAMKAGTTTLFELLAQHPRLCRTWAHVPGVSFPKEINYFNKLYRKGDTPLHYDWRFPFDATTHSWTLDVSPNYAKWPASKGVRARIASLGGQTKLAYILRDPVDRIESHLAHMLSCGEKIKHIEYCIRTSCYALQLDKFMAYFAPEDILLLDFERLVNEPHAVLAQVCDFLGIERTAISDMAHNRRSFDFRLDARRRAEFTEAVQPDVQRLIEVYGFEPARSWLR